MSHVTHMNEPCHTYERVTAQTRMSHVTHMAESCHALTDKCGKLDTPVHSHVTQTHLFIVMSHVDM